MENELLRSDILGQHKYQEGNNNKKLAVLHIPQFGDAASPMVDVDVSAGDAHL
jgi:hypothetical protein